MSEPTGLTVKGRLYIAEIPCPADLAECHRNIDASLEYLRKQGLMGYFS